MTSYGIIFRFISMLKCLKEATGARHAALERRLPLLNADLTLSTYLQFVQKLHGFYDPLESALNGLPWWATIDVDYSLRRKTPRLREDLLALGHTDPSVAALPHCRSLPPLTTEAQLWGCLYVIEGATLGGQIIIKNLHRHIGLTAMSGASFFDGYGAQTGSRWKAFCAALMARDADCADDRDETLHSANQTFDALGAWLFPGFPTHFDLDLVKLSDSPAFAEHSPLPFSAQTTAHE